MGGRGAGSGLGKHETALITGTRDLIAGKVGKTFEKLPKLYQDNINKNLKMSDFMKNAIAKNRPHVETETWRVGLGGIKEKRSVTTDVINGKAVYTVKQGNKILRKNITKEQAANEIAQFYWKYLKPQKK